MKTKKLFSSIFLALMLLSILGAFAPSGVKADAGASFWIEDASVILNGTRPVSASMSSIRSIPTDFIIGLDATTKLVETIILDGLNWNAGDDLAPSDYASSGITRTYSSSVIGSVTLPSTSGASGVYSTLRATDENNYAEQTKDKDLDVYTFYTLDNLYDTVNTKMVSYGYTVANYTCNYAKLRMVFDRTLVDVFFGDIAGDDDFAELRDEDYTSTTAVADLFEDHFKYSMLDLIYSKINVTDYATSWTIGSEVQSVLGGNATDLSIDGTGNKHVSVRNAATGFIGLYMADDATIDPPSTVVKSVLPGQNADQFVKLLTTDDSYIIDFNIFSDFVSSSLIIDHFGLALAQIFPHVTIGDQLAFPLYVHLIIIAVAALIGGGIGYFVGGKDKKAFWKAAAWTAIGIGIMMFLAFPVSSIF